MVAEELRKAGHDAAHVLDYGMDDAPDAEILDRAAREDRIVLAADTDFGALLLLEQRSRPSAVLYRRIPNRRPAEQAALLLTHLPELCHSLQQGCVAIVEEDRIRVRLLNESGDDRT